MAGLNYRYGLALLAFSGLVQADAELEYQQCLLQHQPKVQLEAVTVLVRQACEKVHLELVLLPRKKHYYQCLLSHLPPVATESSIQDVMGACASKFDFRR